MLIAVAGGTIHVEVMGEGLPFFVPCTAGTAVFKQQFAQGALLRHLQMIFVDLRGSGRSQGEWDPAQLTMQDFVDDLEAVRRHLGHERAGFLTWSAGNLMATEYALQHPDRVTHLVFASAAPPRFYQDWRAAHDAYWDSMASPERNAAHEARLAALSDEELAKLPPLEQHGRRFVRNGAWYYADPHTDGTATWVDASDWNMAFVNRVFRELAPAYDPSSRLPEIGAPVLLVHGKYNFAVPPTMWEPYLPSLRRATYRVLPESGHFPMTEQPEAFAQTVLTWLAEHQ